MNHRESPQALDRRALLSLGALGAGALLSSRANGAVKLFGSPQLPEERAVRPLILLQLSGGNDGLSTVVPYAEDAYHRARPSIAHKKDKLLVLDEYRGLHGELKRLRKAFDAGQLAIVEGVGYPQPIRSHFQSLDIWHAADARGRGVGSGWIGRVCEKAFESETNPNLVVHVGSNVPYSLHSTKHPAATFVNPAAYRWAGGENETDAYAKASGMGAAADDLLPGAEKPRKREGESSLEFLRRVMNDGHSSSLQVRRAAGRYTTPIVYPRNDALAGSLRDVAALVNSDIGSRVLSLELGGFDTHTDQKNRHDNLMKQLDGALGAFLEDLGRSERGRAAVVVVFSEFGRRVAENGSRGTDHGVAAPLFLLGHKIKGGLHGKHPSFEALDEGDLAHTTDFRSVYATLIERCFGLKHDDVLGAKYPLAPIA
jgi:uncharacterized protein (DUF1501 family)